MDLHAELNLKQVAAELGVHYMTAYRYVRTGRLVARKVGTNWVVDRSSLDELVEHVGTEPHTAEVDWQGRLHERLVGGDDAGAWSVVQDALVAGWTAEGVLVDLLIPAVARTSPAAGAHAGHLVAMAAQRTSAVLAAQFRRRGRHRGTVVLGTPVGEDHSLALALLTDLLRLRNFAVLELGGGATSEAFVAASSRAERLLAVGVGVTQVDQLTRARDVVLAVRAAVPSARILLGGQAVTNPEVAALVGADAWSAEVDGVAALIEAGLPDRRRRTGRAVSEVLVERD